ncbi:MAG: glycosyltransferase [Verrucomicrobiota bacterium]
MGYNIELFGVPCPDGWWPFPKLDAAWKRRVPELMQSYERIASSARRGDILATSGGAMVHPEFVQQLPTFNVFICGDDPESSEILSKPAAPAFDVSLIGNVACIDLYRSWGCRHVDWLYQAIRPELSDPTLTEDRILSEPRDLDLVMLCERIYNASDRASRVEQLHRTFPNAFIRGRGWPGGHVEPAPVYRRAKIGWNLHNSVGPCNTRLVTLPAFGVMQICDNKANLGQLFKLDDEVVGFDSIEECVEKTRYYLAHDLERRQIAVRGWKRAMAEFTEEKQWSRLLEKISVPYREKFSKLNPARVSAGPVSASRARRSFDDRRVGVAVAPRGRVSYEPALVRELIGQAISLYTGGQSDLGTLLSGGESVLIKPNWVLHLNKSGETMDCMVTHSEFLLAAVELVAARRPARIVIADAPCNAANGIYWSPCRWSRRSIAALPVCRSSSLIFEGR